jgi:hypothetical protein
VPLQDYRSTRLGMLTKLSCRPQGRPADGQLGLQQPLTGSLLGRPSPLHRRPPTPVPVSLAPSSPGLARRPALSRTALGSLSQPACRPSSGECHICALWPKHQLRWARPSRPAARRNPLLPLSDVRVKGPLGPSSELTHERASPKELGERQGCDSRRRYLTLDHERRPPSYCCRRSPPRCLLLHLPASIHP